MPEPEEFASFSLVFPEFPQRPFSPRELSDGQMRFLALAGMMREDAPDDDDDGDGPFFR